MVLGALRQHGRDIGRLDAAYAELRKRVGLPPVAPPTGSALPPLAKEPLTAEDGKRLEPRQITVAGNTVVLDDGYNRVTTLDGPDRARWRTVPIAAHPSPGDADAFVVAMDRALVAISAMSIEYVDDAGNPSAGTGASVQLSNNGGKSWSAPQLYGLRGGLSSILDYTTGRADLVWSEQDKHYWLPVQPGQDARSVEPIEVEAPLEEGIYCLAPGAVWRTSPDQLYLMNGTQRSVQRIDGFQPSDASITCTDSAFVSYDSGRVMACTVDGCRKGSAGVTFGTDFRLRLALADDRMAVGAFEGGLLLVTEVGLDANPGSGRVYAFGGVGTARLDGLVYWDNQLHAVMGLGNRVIISPVPITEATPLPLEEDW